MGLLSIGWSGEPLWGEDLSAETQRQKEPARRRVSRAVDTAGIKAGGRRQLWRPKCVERKREKERKPERSVRPGSSRPGTWTLRGVPWNGSGHAAHRGFVGSIAEPMSGWRVYAGKGLSDEC